MSTAGKTFPRRAGVVVILDDNQALLGVYRNILSSEGFQVEGVSSLAAVTAILQRPEPPALLVIDSFMPSLSGEEVLDALEAQFPKILQTVPVVGISAALRGMPLVDNFAVRVTEFVQKPHQVDALIAIVEKYVRKSDDPRKA